MPTYSPLMMIGVVYLDNVYPPARQAVASEGGTDDAKRRGDAFARAFSAHLARLIMSTKC